MTRLAGIALNTFRETVRRPFYYLLLAGAAAALLATLRLPFFTLGRSAHYGDTDMYKDLGLSFVLVFVLLLAVLGAATSVAKEVEDKTAQTILSKAVGRWQFIVGKYLGVMVAVAIGLAVLGAARPPGRRRSRTGLHPRRRRPPDRSLPRQANLPSPHHHPWHRPGASPGRCPGGRRHRDFHPIVVGRQCRPEPRPVPCRPPDRFPRERGTARFGRMAGPLFRHPRLYAVP